jgi:hypothetical protein
MTMIDDKALFTPTMAKVLEDQGYLREAAKIYTHLLEQIPGHLGYRDKVDELENRLAETDDSEDRLSALFEEWVTLALGHQRLRQLNTLHRLVKFSNADGADR